MVEATSRFRDVLQQRATNGATALLSDSGSYSYAELLCMANGLASSWRDAGVKPGDRVAVELPNGPEFVVCYLAGLFGCYPLVPINSGISSTDLDYIIEVTSPALRVSKLDLDKVVSGPGTVPELSPEQTFAISFTSGTTSRPKGVCHRVEALLGNAFAFNAAAGLDDSTRMLHVLPMGYMAGFLNAMLSPLAAGGGIVIAPQFSAASAREFWAPAIEHGANSVWLTPTMVALLARLHRDPEITAWAQCQFEHVFVGTAPLPTLVAERFRTAFHVPCRESYGMTEVLIVSVAEPDAPPGTVGKLLEGVAVEARASEGSKLGMGVEGDLYVASDYELKGYLDPATGMPRLSKDDEFFATGDYGRLDGDGNLFITGRTKDLIIRGGTNISPRAVEDALIALPGVVDAAVVGTPHDFWGEEVVAFLVCEGVAPELEVVRESCRKSLVEDALPARVEVLAELPRSSTGKVAKNELRAML